MKILICAPGYNYIGKHDISIFALDQAKALKNMGHDVRMCFLDLRSFRRLRVWGNQKFEKEGIGIFTTNIPCGPIPQKLFHAVEGFGARICLNFVMRGAWKPDIIHTHFLETSHAFANEAKVKKIPIVMTEHWSRLLEQNVTKKIIALCLDTYWKADKVLTVSSSLQAALYNYLNKDLPINVVWNIVDIENFERKRNEKLNKFSFLSCGSLIRRKGFDCLIKSFTALHSNAELIIMGDGPERSNLESLAQQLGVSDRVRFTGKYKREQMAEELANANCFVLASRFETFGVVYIEAMAAGVPVIATDCGGPRDFVNDKVGVLVPVDNVEALRQAMQDMIDGKVKYDSEEIRQYALDNFSPRVIAERLTKVYEEVLENR